MDVSVGHDLHSMSVFDASAGGVSVLFMSFGERRVWNMFNFDDAGYCGLAINVDLL